jgi:hypothetical protein
MEGKGDGCLEGNSCLKWGKQMSNQFLASKILDLFEEIEGILRWMFPYQPCSNYKVRLQPRALGMSYHPSSRHL